MSDLSIREAAELEAHGSLSRAITQYLRLTIAMAGTKHTGEPDLNADSLYDEAANQTLRFITIATASALNDERFRANVTAQVQALLDKTNKFKDLKDAQPNAPGVAEA